MYPVRYFVNHQSYLKWCTDARPPIAPSYSAAAFKAKKKVGSGCLVYFLEDVPSYQWYAEDEVHSPFERHVRLGATKGDQSGSAYLGRKSIGNDNLGSEDSRDRLS